MLLHSQIGTGEGLNLLGSVTFNFNSCSRQQDYCIHYNFFDNRVEGTDLC